MQKYSKKNRKQKQGFEKQIRSAKLAQKKKLSNISSRHWAEKIIWQRKLGEQARRDKQNFKREFVQLKKSYQLQLEYVRDICHSQTVLIGNKLTGNFDKQIELNKKGYETAISNSQAQLERLQKWFQDELIHQLLEKKGKIESSEAELKTRKLADQLKERNLENQDLQEKVQKLEMKTASRFAQILSGNFRGAPVAHFHTQEAEDENHGDVKENFDTQQQLLDMLMEIGREKVKMDKESQRHFEKEAEANSEWLEHQEPPAMEAWWSRMARKKPSV